MVVFEILVGVLDAPAAAQPVHQRGPFEFVVGGEDLEGDLSLLVGRELADRPGVVALEVDRLVGEQAGAPAAVDLHPGALRRDGGGDKGRSAPGDPFHVRLGERAEHLGVGPAPVEADHHRAVPDDLFELAEHLGQAHRQAPRLARGKADGPPGLVDDEGVVAADLNDLDTAFCGARAV